MKNMVSNSTKFLLLAMVAVTLFSCKKKTDASSATGWNYNDPKMGGFEVAKNKEQKNAPGLKLVPGGTFVMGNVEEDVTYEYDNIPKKVTVSSFYMDETEVSNVHYREYIHWMERTFGETYPQLVRKSLPDTLVWYEELGYNEPFVKYYYRHPAYNDYPAVGVTWEQANEYCKWRSDRVNENELIKEGIVEYDPNQYGAENFNTEAYLLGQYEGIEKKGLPNLDPNGEPTRRVRFDDGILLPDYRLPTEAEWEYAALAVISAPDEERYDNRKSMPWEGSSVR